MNKSKRYLVGEFSLTDNNCKFKNSGFVEVESKFSKPLILLLVSPFKDSSTFISFAFDAIKARAFAYSIKKLISTGHSSMIHSGGVKTNKNIKLSINSSDKEDREATIYLDISESGGKELKFSLPMSEAYGYSQELEYLVQECMDATYKMQRFIDRKLKKEAKR